MEHETRKGKTVHGLNLGGEDQTCVVRVVEDWAGQRGCAVEDWAKGMCGGRLGKGDDHGQDAYLIGR